MRRLLKDFDDLFDLTHRIGDATLGDLLEQTVAGLGQSSQNWGTEGRRQELLSESGRFVSFYYRPHLFPGMELKLRLAHELQYKLLPQELPPGSPVEVSEASVGGLGLMERLLGFERVILIDALYSESNNPGTVHRLTLDDLQAISPTQHSVSAHDTNLNTALNMARKMGLPLPKEVIIFGIEVENIIDFSDEPTPAVKRAIPEVTVAVLQEINTVQSSELTVQS